MGFSDHIKYTISVPAEGQGPKLPCPIVWPPLFAGHKFLSYTPPFTLS
jgi:hypothetical protein